MATWLRRPIMYSPGSPDGAKRNPGPAPHCAALHAGYEQHKLYRQYLHQAYRLLLPMAGDRGTHAALDRLLDRLRIAPARFGQRFERLDRGVVGDLMHRLLVGID